MFNRKVAKRNALKNLKKHYLILVFACLLATYLGVANTGSLSWIKSRRQIEVTDTVAKLKNNGFSIEDVANEVYTFFKQKTDTSTIPDNVGIIQLGTTNGVLSGVINKIGDGRGIAIIYETVTSIVKSESVSLRICIGVLGLIIFALNLFIRNTYKVAFRRVYLEGYKYEKVRYTSFFFLIRVKRFAKGAWTMFRTAVYQFLWDLTIIGGIVKIFSYRMMPYIVAENPDIDFNEAIELSRRMMYGHKIECLKLDFSMLPLQLISLITFGLSDVLFTNPYIESVYLEYYVYLRGLAKNKKISYANRLNDKYLFEKADNKLIEETYSDVVDILTDDIDVRDLKNKGFRGFVENVLGIIYRYDKKEDIYNTAIEQEEKIDEYKSILDLKQYPSRLSPIPVTEKDNRVEKVHYLRHYSIWSLIGMFFMFSFVGWIWEVSLGLVENAEIVNRGVLHGPWLPIYGFGCLFIMTVLYRFRRKPVLEALMTILLCGFIEYSTAFVLETVKHIKWWDYTGYFLNIHGRICAEGLLVFMLGGLVVVYALGPLIDNAFRKINSKVLIPILCVLMILFTVDAAYSIYKPNTGKGISDYSTPIEEKFLN